MNYEFHITLENANKTKFIKFCEDNSIKPIILDIQRKDGSSIYHEVMTSSKHILDNDNDAINRIEKLSKLLTKEGFKVIRKKIEAEASHSDVDKLLPNTYLESHLNVFVNNKQSESNLYNICKTHSCHLSKNISKTTKDGYIIMVTYREQCKLNTFKHKLNSIISKKYKIDKGVIEYSIYDSNLSYDNMWVGVK